MVGFSICVEKAGVMIVLKWFTCNFLPLFLLLGSSSGFQDRGRVFGDLNEDEVAIDRMEDFLARQEIHNGVGPDPIHPRYNLPDLTKVNEKIDFAVPPTDTRYHMPSSLLRKAQMGDASLSGSMMGKGPHSNLPQDYSLQEMALLQDLYSKYGPNGEYTGHKFGPLPVTRSDEDSASSDPESVNFLQESRHQAEVPHYFLRPSDNSAVLSDFYFVALVSGCTAAAVCGVLGAGICYFRLHKSKRDAADAEYPAYGVTGPCKDFSPAAADRKLAQSAHMFHYQHQKQQMIALEKSSGDERHCSTSDVDSEEEGEEGDYTVYECPGLAPTSEMEVKNPMYSGDPTPATPSANLPTKGTNDIRKDDDDDDDED